MKNYQVFQILLTDADSGMINILGWQRASAASTRVRCHLANSMPFGDDKIIDMDAYTCTMTVNAESLDHVFELTNLWDDESKIMRHRSRVRSGSVGDIIFDAAAGTYHMIASFGFDDITEEVNKEKHA